MRGRGLKPPYTSDVVESYKSPPMRGRGLKQRERGELQPAAEVAPHAGAWIETPSYRAIPLLSKRVAPHAGAWIETRLDNMEVQPTGSPPMRGRGLKRGRGGGGYGDIRVAPHAGAWIETMASPTRNSRPTVAPHAGAWIETRWTSRRTSSMPSPPMRGRGLKLP